MAQINVVHPSKASVEAEPGDVSQKYILQTRWLWQRQVHSAKQRWKLQHPHIQFRFKNRFHAVSEVLQQKQGRGSKTVHLAVNLKVATSLKRTETLAKPYDDVEKQLKYLPTPKLKLEDEECCQKFEEDLLDEDECLREAIAIFTADVSERREKGGQYVPDLVVELCKRQSFIR